MDVNQQGIHAFATKQGKEWTTFSYKVIFEATEEKLKINSTGNLCYSAYNTNRNINASSENSQNLGESSK